jgi:ethanolamine utilization protein EutP
MKKMVLIGSVGAGKTTISQVLMKQEITYKKTQMIEVLDSTVIDTPGEYMDRVQMRGALIITSVEADVICLVQSAADMKSMIPPGYVGAFAKPVIGIVTQIDLADEKQIQLAADKLRNAGVKEVFPVSCFTKQGFEPLIEYLRND